MKTIAETMEELAKAVEDSPKKPGMFLLTWGHKIYSPHIRLRIEIQYIDQGNVHFVIKVDFSLPQGASSEQADEYAIWAREAANKGIEAQKIVQGRKWTTEEALKYYDGEEI